MLSNHRLQEVLEEIADISRIGLILYDEKGKLLASSGETEAEMSHEVEQFARSMAESQILSGYHFFKVAVDQEVEYILLAKANYDEAYMVGRLAVCQIRNMILANREISDRNNFMQNILLGNMLVVDIYNKARKLHIEQARRLVYVVEVEGRRESIVMEIVKNLFAGRSRDFVTEINEQTVILIKDASSIRTDEDAMELAETIAAHIQAEAMVKVRVGYGNVVDTLPDIAKSYQEAKMALEVGRIFYAGKETISYGKLGIGRLIYQLPMSLCEMFVREVFGDHVPDIDDETMVTIQKFFDNSLNISETARQLYIHRNTLVYRLERLQKMIGLDIRNFEEALTFKIAMMVIAHMGEADNE